MREHLSVTRQRIANPGEINFHAVDRFTLVHGAVGAGLGALGLPWWAAIAVTLGWELVERPLKDHYPQMFPHSTQDTMDNVVGDVAAFMLGWGGGRTVRQLVRKG